ncbi:Death-associated protein kinase [Phytophthora cinnamomi]|uniref:Death-associated protein kinase n=1 Tax=Phytophthora cinnamomi TaxID=4785 RepID=UPI00355A011F|nr:Death-associated protein kinase [Phytophthora cinnamomi]
MVGEVKSDELVLHAVFKGEVKKKQQWLRERGVSPEDSMVAGGDLTELLQYIEEKQITSIPLDELKTTWNALEEETFHETKALVEGGADISAKDKLGGTALHAAARNGNTNAISLLLDRGADVNAADIDGWTALHAAARNIKTDAISLLLDRGANVNATYNRGETALYSAAAYGNTNAISLLLDRGADLNATDNLGWTALHAAAVYGNTNAIMLLLDRGANVNAENKDGWTALHHAAGHGNTDAVSLLLDRGASIDAVDKKNHSPLTLMIWETSKDDLDKKIVIARFHVDHFQTGVSVLSIISEAIPSALVKGTMQKALSESKDALVTSIHKIFLP